MAILSPPFFNRAACDVARALLGKIIRRKVQGHWLAARIIETESYYIDDKGSHASLGYTEKRKALFMPPGTIYMYYARGKDSFNVSCKGDGNAVLIKSAFPFEDEHTDAKAIPIMHSLNPTESGELRPIDWLCRGQTLLCAALNIRVSDWDQAQFNAQSFYLEDAGLKPKRIIQTTRLGIPQGRDEHLKYRYIDYDFARYCTSNPLTKRGWIEGEQYLVI